MNIVNQLTLRHLKKNKRRTLVTIVGVIISVAMVTAVATLVVSFMDLLQRQTIASEGEWHVLYENINKDQLEAVKNDSATKTVVISKDIGYAALEGSQNENKPYLFVKAYNTQGFEQFPIHLSEGRLPQAADEVVISEHIETNAKVAFDIGDSLTLDIGERAITEGDINRGIHLGQQFSLQTDDGKVREKLSPTTTQNYTIVGKIKRPNWEPTWAPGYTVISYTDESLLSTQNTVQASVVLKKVTRSLYTHAEQFAEENHIESVRFNYELLRYYGVTNNNSLRNTLLSLSAIIMTVIIVGSVSLIYNAFAISVSERSRHLGMLSSVGATNRQKKNSVFFEGGIIGLISIPIGIICGLAGIGLTFLFINSMIQDALGLTEKLRVVFTPVSIAATCAVSLLTIFISTYIPAMKASRISAIDAIRQTADIKLTGKAVKTSKLVRRLFGIEAEIGLKNLKRNKRRYQSTVFSLIISIVLFLAVSYFTGNLQKSLQLSQDGINYDIEVSLGDKHEGDEQLVRSIIGLEDVTEFSTLKEVGLTAWIDEKSVADELKYRVEGGRFPYYIRINALDEKSFQAYAQKARTNAASLVDPDHPSAIVIDMMTYQDREKKKYVESKAIHAAVGETIHLIEYVGESGAEKAVTDIRIAALTDQLPLGIRSTEPGGLDIVVSKPVFDQIVSHMSRNNQRSLLYLKSSNPMATQQQIEEMKESNIYIYNVYKSRQQEQQMIMIMSVFTYGFILLITAISVANIFNTISTSIALRKREFAMLKSVGMTPKGFNKMINYESIFYGIKSLLYGLPISILVMYLIHRGLANSFSYTFTLPWISMASVIAAVFIIVGLAMLYSSAKVKKENIVDALKQESI